MQDIKFISPPGSGNTFAIFLLNQTLKCQIDGVSHKWKDLDKDGNRIFLLRNPYDCIASATERHLDTVNHDSMGDRKISIKNIDDVVNEINLYTHKYYEFLKRARNKKILFSSTFEFLSLNPIGFVKKVSNFFDIEIDHSNLNSNLSAEVFEGIKKSKLANRSPRDKTESRNKIDELVRNNVDINLFYKEYIQYRDILQSTEIYSTIDL
jgi:hypothetical protein